MSDMFNASPGGCGSGQCACKSEAQQRTGRPLLDDIDYGTPPRQSEADVTLDIDG